MLRTILAVALACALTACASNPSTDMPPAAWARVSTMPLTPKR